MTQSADNFDHDLAELVALRQDAEALSRRFAAGERAVTQASAADPAERVQVVLAGDGRITTVEVDESWRRRTAVASVGSAVLAAYEEAGRRRSQAWATAVSRAPARGAADEGAHAPAAGDDMVGSADARPDPTSAGAVDFGHSLFQVLQDVSAGLPQLAAEVAEHARQVVTARNPQGTVTVTLTGGALTAVDADAGWLDSARHDEIGAAITTALRAGYAAVDEQAGSSPLRRWPYAELDRLTADPIQLLTNLGLPVPRAPHGRP